MASEMRSGEATAVDAPAPTAADPVADRRRAWVTGVLVAIPFLAVLAHAAAWVRLGMDMPFMDDWWQIRDGVQGSFDPAYLLTPVNATVMAVGKMFDSLNHRLLGGNILVYNLLSLVLMLGGLLLLQWRALSTAVSPRILAGVVFLLTLASVRVGTLWGTNSNGFHQGLPIVLILACLWLMLRPQRLSAVGLAAIAGLSLAAGLTYISGGFAVPAVGATMLGIGWFSGGPNRRSLLLGGGAMLAVGSLAAAIQTFQVFGGGGGAPLTMPWEPRYWAFAFGKLAGSLWVPRWDGDQSEPWVDLVAGVVALGLLTVAIGLGVRAILRDRPFQPGRDLAIVMLIGLTVACVVYAMLVAAARTESGTPDGAPLIEYFATGRMHHHVFWFTTVWPWLVAALLTFARRRSPAGVPGRWAAAAAGTFVVVMLALSVSRGSFEFDRHYAGVARLRTETADCLVDSIGRGIPLICSSHRLGTDLTIPVMRAMENGTTFARYLRFPPMADSVPPLYRRAEGGGPPVPGNDTTAIEAVTAGDVLSGPGAALAWYPIGDPAEMARCRMLEVRGTVDGTAGSGMHAAWERAGAPGVRFRYLALPAGDGPHPVRFDLVSADGFADRIGIRIALPPATIGDLEVRCRLSHPG